MKNAEKLSKATASKLKYDFTSDCKQANCEGMTFHIYDKIYILEQPQFLGEVVNECFLDSTPCLVGSVMA